MGSAGEDTSPLCEEALVTGGKGKSFHFVRGEPAQFDAFWADFEHRIFWGDEHPADIVVLVLRFTWASWDHVNVEIERARGGEDESLDTGFLEGLALGNREHILFPVAMPPERQPLIEFTVMMKEGLRSVRTHQHYASREVSGKGRAQEALLRRVEKPDHLGPERYLVQSFRKIESLQGRAEEGTIHGTVAGVGVD